MPDNNRPFEFTFIIAAYNCGEYLEEAIDSILAQKGYDIAGNVQVVVVDDGSSDDTAVVCERYAHAYPQVISYLHQENQGAAAARLAGLEHAQGSYINFLDADDKWSDNVCSCMHRFFANHPEVGICTAKHGFFEAKTGFHQLSYKYKADSVVDLTHVSDYPQLSYSNAFIRRELIKQEYFDSRLSLAEDTLVVNRILMNTMCYGALHEPIYWYRKRDDGSSAIDKSGVDIQPNLNRLRFCYKTLFDESNERFGCVLPFLQYVVMYDLQWQLKKPLPVAATNNERSEYRKLVENLLADISNEVILTQRNMKLYEKLYVLSLKHKIRFVELQDSLKILGDSVFLDNKRIGRPLFISSVEDQSGLIFNFIHLVDNHIRFEGRLNTLFPADEVQVHALNANMEVMSDTFSRIEQKHDGAFDNAYTYDLGFCLDIPLPKKGKKGFDFWFEVLLDGHALTADIVLGKFTPLTDSRYDYGFLGDYVITKKNINTFGFAKRNRKYLLKREFFFEANQFATNKQLRASGNLKYRRYAARKGIKRYLAESGKRQAANAKRKQIWLLIDRTIMAGDNAEALFHYIHDHPLPNVKPYFLLNADSPDFERMKQYGNVVAFGSPKHIKLQILADKILSSAGDGYIFSRLLKEDFLLRGFQHWKIVFLQHGITKDDMSRWLNRYSKNIALFLTASPYERNSIVNTPAYSYAPEQVPLTGFPRHDRLFEAARATQVEKKIAIIPTWREDLAGKSDPHTGKRAENPGFENTDYYAFYQSLINDERLIRMAKDKGFAISFLIHPALSQEAHKFHSDFAHVETEYHYTDEFTRSAILVTDFSSVAFDFALLKKPLIYSQFDADKFYARHGWDPSYFSYEENGFGGGTYDLESTVDALCALMENPVMPEKYQKRVDDFFYQPETSRCEAVIDAILKLDE
jgi:glycosyltransferase involved in cell wall biosynthesis/CDP-glycerol glycerophosphotransferase (TagB/SpsB family)